MQTLYLEAADTLAQAEQIAWETRSFDTLSRLYLPLQEARRQIRQRCGEGAVRMHLIARSPNETIDPHAVLEDCPFGQLLIAGWETPQPAAAVRRLARDRRLFVETFLASAHLSPAGQLRVKLLPFEDWPVANDCLTLLPENLPADAAKGNAQTFAAVMDLWESLHRPFLIAAAEQPDPVARMQGYRTTLRIDPACELAHQFLADIARSLARNKRLLTTLTV